MKSGKNFLIGFLAAFSLLVVEVQANNTFEISDDKFNEIESRVKGMNYDQLVATRKGLISERANLNMLQENTQSPSQTKAISSRLKEITAELSAIQKVLLGLVGAAAVSNLTDDGYNDIVPPVITINGDNPATVELGTTYTDAGATANDAFHGSTPVSSTGVVDTSTVGTYTINYTATDLDGNTATASRTVNVVDTTAPVITLTGDATVTVELGTSYTDAGATATDASGAISVTSSGTVDTDTVGTYVITYNASDASGNAATAVTRTVNVVDTTAPVFTSSSTFVVDEGATNVGTVTATDLQAVTFTLSGDARLAISTAGVLTFVSPADYEDPARGSAQNLDYDGSTYDITATVTATDASENASDQIITVSIRDFGGIDDDRRTGEGTSTSTVTQLTDTNVVEVEVVESTTTTSTGTATATATGTATATATGTATGTGTGTATATTTTGTQTQSANGTISVVDVVGETTVTVTNEVITEVVEEVVEEVVNEVEVVVESTATGTGTGTATATSTSTSTGTTTSGTGN